MKGLADVQVPVHASKRAVRDHLTGIRKKYPNPSTSEVIGILDVYVRLQYPLDCSSLRKLKDVSINSVPRYLPLRLGTLNFKPEYLKVE